MFFVRLIFGNVWAQLLIAIAAGTLALKGYGWSQQKKGAAKAVAKIEHAEQKHVRAARNARNSSRAGRGVYDPYTRSN